MAKKSRQRNRGGTKKNAKTRTLRRRMQRKLGINYQGVKKRINRNMPVTVDQLIPNTYYEITYIVNDQDDLYDDTTTIEGIFYGRYGDKLMVSFVPSSFFDGNNYEKDKGFYETMMNFYDLIPVENIVSIYGPTTWAMEKIRNIPSLMDSSHIYAHAAIANDKKTGTNKTMSAFYGVLGDGEDTINEYI